MSSFPVIDRYEIRRGLGRGAMGSVYLAWDPKMGREVAVKVLQKEFAHNAKHRQRFEREARAIAALKHPNIVDIYDFGGSPDDHMFLVMEYVEGTHAGKAVREGGVFPESVILAVGMGLASALREAHKAGIIHRDLKPENVFLDRGRVVLGDFGIVKAIQEENPLGADAASALTDVIGTPGFMAPEQLEQQPLDPRTDIFSFGALLYYLGSKRLPYDADSPYGLMQMFRDTRPNPLADLRPELSEYTSRLVQDCLEVNPDARPVDMESVHKRLRDNLERLGARDPRDVLMAYLEDPVRFRADDRTRVVKHLVSRLKIAVRDEDGIAADEARARLAVLDPDNDEAVRVTGVTQLIKSVPRDPDDVDFSKPTRRGGAILLLAAAAAAAMVGATWLLTRSGGSSGGSPIETQLKPVSMLRVKSSERTHVYLDGRALGTTPNFPPAMVPAGTVMLEFVHDKKGKLNHRATLEAGRTVVVTVDWKKRKVRLRSKGKSKR